MFRELLVLILLLTSPMCLASGNLTATVIPPITIELLSPPTIEGECLAPADGSDAVLNMRCRTIILGMYGGTFPSTSLALTSVIQNRVLRPGYLADRLAFGIAQRWAELSDSIIVRTVTTDTISLMFIELPNCGSYDLSQDEVLYINTEVPDLVQQFTTPSSGVITVALEKQPPAEVNWRIVAFGYFSAVPASISAVQPFVSTISELQYLLLFTRSTSCSFPYVRSLSTEMFRLVFPSVEVGRDNDGGQLMHNSLITIFIFIFQGFLVVVCKILLKCPLRAASALLYFPSFYMSVCLFLMPGMMFASTKLVFYGGEAGRVVGGLAGILYCTFITFGMTNLARRWFVNVSLRSTSAHLIDFPKVVLVLMPTRSWGPSPNVNSYLVPCGYIGSPALLWHAYRPFAIAMVVGFVAGFEPFSPTGCAAQAGAMTVLVVGIPIYEYRRNLYRCVSLGLMSSATMLFTSLVTLTFLIHGIQPTAVKYAESPLTVMITTVVFAVVFRSLTTIGVSLLEYLVVRPRVWPAPGGLSYRGQSVGLLSDSDSGDGDNASLSSSVDKSSMTSSLTAGKIIAAVGKGERSIEPERPPLLDGTGMYEHDDQGADLGRQKGKNASFHDSIVLAAGQAKGFVKGRLRTVSRFIEEKTDANAKAMLDSDDEQQAAVTGTKRMSRRRAKLLRRRAVDPDDVETLRALLLEEEASFDRIHSIESQRQFDTTADRSSLGIGRSASFVAGNINSHSSGNYLGQVRGNTTLVGTNAYSPPVLGPIPQLDPAISRRTQLLASGARLGDAGGAQSVAGGKGVRFQLSGGKPPPIANVLQGLGPMPPEMAEQQRKEYDML